MHLLEKTETIFNNFTQIIRPLRNQFRALVLSLRTFSLKHCKLVWIFCTDYFYFYYFFRLLKHGIDGRTQTHNQTVGDSLTHTVVTEAAVGGTWRSEDLAGEAILQLDCLAVDDHLLCPGGRPVAGAAVSHIFGKEWRDGGKEKHQESHRERPKEPLEGNFFTSHVLCYTDIDDACAETITQRYLKEKRKIKLVWAKIQIK